MTGSWGWGVCSGATPLWSKNPLLSGAWWELHCVGPGQRSEDPLLFQHGETLGCPVPLCLFVSLPLTHSPLFGHIHTEAESDRILIFVRLTCDTDVMFSYAVNQQKIFTDLHFNPVFLLPLVFSSFPLHMLSLSFLSVTLWLTFFPSHPPLFLPSLIAFTFSLCFPCCHFLCHLMHYVRPRAWV